MSDAAGAGARKALEVFEELGQWAGSDVRVAPSGSPARALVDDFAARLQDGSGAAGGNGQVAVSTPGMEGLAPGPAAAMPSVSTWVHAPDSLSEPGMARRHRRWTQLDPVQQETLAMQAESPTDGALQALLQMTGYVTQSGTCVSAEMLLQIQYLAGMLRVQVNSGVNASQQVSQGLDNLLRQSG